MPLISNSHALKLMIPNTISLLTDLPLSTLWHLNLITEPPPYTPPRAHCCLQDWSQNPSWVLTKDWGDWEGRKVPCHPHSPPPSLNTIKQSPFAMFVPRAFAVLLRYVHHYCCSPTFWPAPASLQLRNWDYECMPSTLTDEEWEVCMSGVIQEWMMLPNRCWVMNLRRWGYNMAQGFLSLKGLSEVGIPVSSGSFVPCSSQ